MRDASGGRGGIAVADAVERDGMDGPGELFGFAMRESGSVCNAAF